MKCKRCTENYFPSVITIGKCIHCLTIIKSGHLPAESFCKSCSMELDVCEQCGAEMRGNISSDSEKVLDPNEDVDFYNKKD